MKIFDWIQKEYQNYQQMRRTVMFASNEALRFGKLAVFALHRDNVKDAEKKIGDGEKQLRSVQSALKKQPRLALEGAYRAAAEEWLEAYFFWQYVHGKPFNPPKDLTISFEEVLGALADVTGEIVRHALRKAQKRDLAAVQKDHAVTEEIVGKFLSLDATGKLRSKADDAKRNLKRLEEMVYDLHLRAG